MLANRLVLALLLLFDGYAAKAQLNPTLSEAERGIHTSEPAEASHLRIDQLSTVVRVAGPSISVTMEMRIASDSADSYEANLTLRLPAGAVVNGYALDVNGAMISGQLLEAPKARNVYEDEVRAGIDPGLSEVAGNRFTTRVFPIDLSHPRRFRVTYVTGFDPSHGIVLPFERDTAVGTISTTVEILGYATPPTVNLGTESIQLLRNADGWGGQASAKNRVVRGGLSIAGGKLNAPITLTRHNSGQSFFSVGGEWEKPIVGVATGGRLRVYWDRSRSHRDGHPELERQVLARLIDSMKPSAINLVTFATDEPEILKLNSGAALRSALERVTYRGGTSLRGLDQLRQPRAQLCVLVSDGEVTIDRGADFAPNCRVIALTAAADANGPQLERIAQRNGGAVVRVTPDHIEVAVAALTANVPSIVAVEDADARRLDYRTLPVAADRWQIVGPFQTAGEIRVRFSDGSKKTFSITGVPIASDAPAVLWASYRLADLSNDAGKHAEMVELAQRYQVAGSGMSFLVLERPDQYLRADITPPPGFSREWIADYLAAKTERESSEAAAKANRLAFVLDQWNARRDWWGRQYTPTKRFSAQPADNAAAPPPPPPPPPTPLPLRDAPQSATGTAESAAAAVSVMDVAEAGASIVVTGSRTGPAPATRGQPQRAVSIELDLADVASKLPYIVALNAATPAARPTVLADQERAYGSIPSFYLDTAEWFRGKGALAVADALLLSALELPSSDDETKQIVAFRLERDGQFNRAVELAEHLAAANAEFRPQPLRDLALALAARGRAQGGGGRADLERAFKLLTDVALNPASKDFEGIEVVSLMEANALIRSIESAGGSWTLDKRLVDLLDTDVRIVISWTADDADIDLWVTEPNGERVYYGDNLSSAGGQISNDMTDGYGPEEYAIHRAPAGQYAVRINGYDADRINPNGPGHVLIRLYRNFARPAEQQVMVDADLSFQAGRDRDDEEKAKPVATLRVR